MTTRQLPPHGTVSRRKHHGCPCWDCCEAVRVYNRERYAAKQAGTWQPFVDAEPIRRHLLNLQAAGIPALRVTELTGLSERAVIGFLRSPAPRTPRKRGAHPETARKILAIPVDVTLATTVDATGTKRRLQALAAAGWPQQYLSRRTGINQKHLSAIIHRQSRVLASTAAKVANAHDELVDLKPERNGVPRASAKTVRAMAAASCWAPAKYWALFPDAIDDPHFIPEYGRSKAELLAEEATFLTKAGLPPEAIAPRLGISRSYVVELLRRSDLQQAA